MKTDVPPAGRLRHRQRIRDGTDFQRVYAARKSQQGAVVTVQFCPNGLAWSRLGLSVSKKHGNAVRRNRIKRVFRAAFRLCQHLLPAGYDFVMLPRKGVEEYSTDAARQALEAIARRIPPLKTAAPAAGAKADV